MSAERRGSPAPDPAARRGRCARPPAGFDPLALLSGSTQLVVLRVAALGLSFGIGLFVARELGAAEFGRFESWLAWTGIVAVASGMGTDKMVVRFTAAYRARGDWAPLRGLLYGLGGAVLAVCGLVAGLAAAVLVLGPGAEALGGEAVALALVLVPATVVLRFLQAALQGLDRVLWSQLADLVVLPLAFAGTFVVLCAREGTASGPDAMASQAVAVVVAAALVGLVLYVSRPQELGRAPTSVALGEWWRQSWLLLALAFLQIGVARLDVVVFDLVGDDADLGHYAAARRIAAPIVAVVLAVNAAAAPVVARLHARGERDALQSLATRMARWTTLAAVAGAAAVGGAGGWVLGWFGPGFAAAEPALRVMVVGQVLNAACGSVVLLLIMTGNTRHALPGLAVGALTQGALGCALIPAHGVDGAAWAAAAGTVVWNLLLAVAVVLHLGIDPSVLGRAGRLAGRVALGGTEVR